MCLVGRRRFLFSVVIIKYGRESVAPFITNDETHFHLPGCVSKQKIHRSSIEAYLTAYVFPFSVLLDLLAFGVPIFLLREALWLPQVSIDLLHLRRSNMHAELHPLLHYAVLA